MMTGMSTIWMACHASCPMPGQLKTDSTTTTPPMNVPMSSPTIETTGSSALRMACLRMTLVSPSPLARAVRT